MAFAFGVLATLPGAAYAQTAAPPTSCDVVTVRGGVPVRGIATDSPSEATVHVRLVNGDVETIPKSEIARIEHGRPCTPPAPTTDRSPVFVYVESPDPVELQVRSHGEWARVCASPCDVRVLAGRRYRIAGDGVQPSPVVPLTGKGDYVELDVDPRSRSAHVTGVVLTSLGGPMMLVGIVGVMIAFVDAAGGGSPAGSDTLAAAGGALFFFGVATLTAGLTVLLSNRHTKVDAHEAVAPPRARPTPVSIRAPIWRGASTGDRALPAPQLFPMVSVAF